MKALIGGSTSTSSFSTTLGERFSIEYLSDAAAARLVTDNGIRIPWAVSLLCLDLSIADDECAGILADWRPSWVEEDDLEVIAHLVGQCRLPDPTHLRLKLGVKGVAGHPGFTLNAVWIDSHGVPVERQPQIDGGIVSLAEHGPRRMSFGQHAALHALASLARESEAHARDLDRVHKLVASFPSLDAGVVLDAFLTRNQVKTVSGVEPRFVPVKGGYQLRAHVPEIPDDRVDDYFYRSRRGELGDRVLTVPTEGGGRTRVVFDDTAKQGLRQLRDLDVIAAEDVAVALTSPEDFFGPGIDVSKLSDRVIGIGLDIRSPYAEFRDKEVGGRDWWSWEIECALEPVGRDDDEAEHHYEGLDLKDGEMRKQLHTAIARADETHAGYIPHPQQAGSFIEVNNSLREAVRSASVLAEEEARNDGRLTRPPRQVLLVHDNLLTVDFAHTAKAKPSLDEGIAVPVNLEDGVVLHPHQQQGYAWLLSLARSAADSKTSVGGLLADDMGLGKTLQVLSLLAQLRFEGRDGPNLVVAPVGLLANWCDEATKFFGSSLEPFDVFQSRDAKRHSVERVREIIGGAGTTLVSYETLRRQEFLFATIDWDVVILDEAQKSKDPSTQIARVLRTLKARVRLAMTGTPVENTLRELWAIYDWATPGLLGSLRQFNDEVIKRVKHASHEERLKIASELHRTVEPVFVRRMKKDVLGAELPALHPESPPQLHCVPLSAEQLETYERFIDLSRGDEPMAALKYLTRLFGTCAHPSLGTIRAGEELPSLDEQPFPKGQKLFELLDDVRSRGEKAIVFANRRAAQYWIAAEVERKYGFYPHVINGNITSSVRRKQYVEGFEGEEGFRVIVLSPRAAGVGLNIVGANHVIHYTREYNPAVENQATDRAYRIGQTKPVFVHAIVTTSEHGTTVEETLADLLREKRELMDDFVVPVGGFAINPDELV